MTTSAVSGKNMSLTIEGDFIGEAQSFALHFLQSTMDVTSKDSDDWGDFLSSRKEWTIDFSGLYISTDIAQRVLVHHFVEGTPAALTVIITMPDGAAFNGEAILTAMDFEGPTEAPLTISGSLKGQGALSQSLS